MPILDHGALNEEVLTECALSLMIGLNYFQFIVLANETVATLARYIVFCVCMAIYRNGLARSIDSPYIHASISFFPKFPSAVS